MPELTQLPPASAVDRWKLALACFALMTLALAMPAEAQEFDGPLITAQERHDHFRGGGHRAFQSALSRPNPTPAEQDVLREGARIYLYGLTLEELRDNLPEEVTNDLMVDIYGAIAAENENARRVVCQAIVDLAPDLMPNDEGQKGQPHIVRLNLAIMLRRLNIRTPDSQQRVAIPFVPARTALLMILNDPTTRTDAKIWAADGLGRICRDAQAGVQDGDLQIVPRAEVGVALANALESEQAINDRTRFYPLRLVEALGDCSLAKTATGQPVMVEALMARLVDQNEHELVRSMAALSLSRLGRVSDSNGLTPPVNCPLVVYEVMRLGGELADKMRVGPGVHTRRSIMHLYFSFVGEIPSEARQQKIGWNNQIERAGLGQCRGMVESAYESMLPLFQEVAPNQNPNVNQQMVENINGWLGNGTNIPMDRKLTPDSDPLPELAGDGDPEGGDPH